jgi:hypothetical protein
MTPIPVAQIRIWRDCCNLKDARLDGQDRQVGVLDLGLIDRVPLFADGCVQGQAA